MADEDRLDSAEIGTLASLPSKKKVKKQVVDLGKGRKFEIKTEVRQTITPSGEIIEESETETKLLQCGHQVSDPKAVKLCGYKDCIVCDKCIVFCEYTDCPNDCHTKGMCKNCAVEYTGDKETFYLCPDCANDYELREKKEKFFNPFKRLFGKEKYHKKERNF
jgi:hypothetical protein